MRQSYGIFYRNWRACYLQINHENLQISICGLAHLRNSRICDRGMSPINCGFVFWNLLPPPPPSRLAVKVCFYTAFIWTRKTHQVLFKHFLTKNRAEVFCVTKYVESALLTNVCMSTEPKWWDGDGVIFTLYRRTRNQLKQDNNLGITVTDNLSGCILTKVCMWNAKYRLMYSCMFFIAF